MLDGPFRAVAAQVIAVDALSIMRRAKTSNFDTGPHTALQGAGLQFQHQQRRAFARNGSIPVRRKRQYFARFRNRRRLAETSERFFGQFFGSACRQSPRASQPDEIGCIAQRVQARSQTRAQSRIYAAQLETDGGLAGG